MELWGIIASILSVFATILFGWLGIHLIRQRRYPGKIVFVKEASIGLFDAIVRNLPELSISYRGQAVSEHLNLVLLKGFLVNMGTKDIAPIMVGTPITFGLPEGYRWLAKKVVSHSPDVVADIVIEQDRELVFRMGLLRYKEPEHVRFEALAEVPMGEEGKDVARRLEKGMTISHRIQDTGKITTERVTRGEIKFWDRNILLVLVFSLAMIGGMSLALFELRDRAVLHFLLTTEKDGIVEIMITPRLDGTLTIEGVEQPYSETVSVVEFFSERQWEPKTANPRVPADVVFLGLGGFIFALGGLSVLLLYFPYRKKIRFRKLLFGIEDKTASTEG